MELLYIQRTCTSGGGMLVIPVDSILPVADTRL